MNIDERVILNSSFGKMGNLSHSFNCRCTNSNTRYTDRRRKYGLTVSELNLVRLLFNSGRISFDQAMNVLKDQYNFYKRVLNEK